MQTGDETHHEKREIQYIINFPFFNLFIIV